MRLMQSPYLPVLLPLAILVALGWFGLRCFGPRTWMPRGIRTVPPHSASRLPEVVAHPRAVPTGKDRTLRNLAAALLLAGLAVASTLLLAPHLAPPALSGEDVGPVHGVGGVLREELPVSPQPLPPALFTGTGSFDLEHADRDWAKLKPGFRQAVLQVFARMEARGYRMALLEGFRSPERQELLARRGPAVTRARAGQSRHQAGLAADVAPMRDGRLSILDRDPWTSAAYQALGEEARRSGLVWGGSWTLRDLGHLEQASRASRPPVPPGA